MTEVLKNIPEDSMLSGIDFESIIGNMSSINLEEYISLERITEYAKGIIGIGSTIFNIFVTAVVSIYLLAERSGIIKFARRLCSAIFNTSTYKTIGKYFRESNEIFFRFVSSQILDAVIVGILTSIAMSILGVRYAVLLGFIIGLFNLIPYLGAIIAIVLAIVITIFTRWNNSGNLDGSHCYYLTTN
ncbi:MAG: AI-2E family transporter [Clostridia bacterium]|nr:AI-2E family transporter [Clostridia bacterium]